MTRLAKSRHTLKSCRLPRMMLAVVGALVYVLVGLGQSRPAQANFYAYVFNVESGDVSIIDTEAQEVIVTVDVGLAIRWFSSRFFDGHRVWAVDGDMAKAEVVVFDPWTLKTLQRIPIGKGPSFSVELTPDLRFAVAHASGSDEVVVIDAETHEIVRRIPVGDFPCDLTLSMDGGLAYEPDRDQDTVSVVDWQSGETLRTIALEPASKPHMLTLSPDGKQLWVEERDASRLSVFDTDTAERIARLSSGKMPATNEFSPSGKYTLVTHNGDNVVKVFETDTFDEVATIEVGESPVNSAFLPDGRFVYVTNQKSGTVSIIDAERWTVVETLEVGENPFGLYLFDPTSGQMAANR